VWMAQASALESVDDKIRKSLVYLEASGLNETNGTKPVTQATGFLVSSDGFILTTYHLLSELGKVAPGSVQIGANVFKKTPNPEFVAVPVQAMPEFDLLLLKVSPNAVPFQPLVLGTLADALSATAVKTSGFPKSANYRPDSGSIGSKDTTSGYLWEVNDMPFDFGQSGSPVYTDEGVVVGVAKGQLDGSPGVNYMIPIQFTDSLLATIRLSDMQAQIASLTDRLNELETKKVDESIARIGEAETSLTEIQSNFLWSAGTSESGPVQNRQLFVEYRRLANKGPEISSIILSIKPYAVGEGGDSITMLSPKLEFYNKPGDGSPPPSEYDPVTRRGLFPVKRALQLVMEHFCESDELKALQRLNIGVIPVLKDGQKLAKETIVVDYPFDAKECSDVLSPNG
jgi:Trypsin-like peptidase domain